MVDTVHHKMRYGLTPVSLFTALSPAHRSIQVAVLNPLLSGANIAGTTWMQIRSAMGRSHDVGP